MRLICAGGSQAVYFTVRPSAISRRYRTGPQPVQLRNKSSSSSSSNAEGPSKSPASPGSPRESAGAENAPSTSQQYSTAACSTSSVKADASGPRPLVQTINLSPIYKIANGYGRAQDRHPYWTQVLSTLVVYLCGDLTAQLLLAGDNKESQDEEKVDGEENHASSTNYDPLRTLRHLSVGVVAAIPVYKWFMFLENNFNFASRPLSIATKVLISQACFTPTFNTYFFSAQSLLAGATLQDTWERLQSALPLSVINSLKVWPAATAFSFAYVDPRFRSIFAGLIAVGWQSYLSWLNQKAAAGQADGTTAGREHLAEDLPSKAGAVLQR